MAAECSALLALETSNLELKQEQLSDILHTQCEHA